MLLGAALGFRGCLVFQAQMVLTGLFGEEWALGCRVLTDIFRGYLRAARTGDRGSVQGLRHLLCMVTVGVRFVEAVLDVD